MPFSPDDGALIMQQSEDLAEAWDNLARQDARVKERIEKVLQGGAWSAVIMSHGALAFQIASNHNLFGAFGIPAPGASLDEEPTQPPPGPTPSQAVASN